MIYRDNRAEYLKLNFHKIQAIDDALDSKRLWKENHRLLPRQARWGGHS